MPKRSESGFSTLELCFIVVVIGVMVAFIAIAYQGVQARNRNQARTKAINATHKQIEAFYQTEGHYPSRRDLNDNRWLSANLKGFDTDLLQDPSSSSKTLVAAPVANAYAYQPLNSSNTSCEEDNTTCSSYSLTATLEGGGTYIKLNTD